MKTKRTEDNWNVLKRELKKGQVVSGTVFKIEAYGVYVDINKDFYGIVLAPQIGKTIITLNEYPKIGDIVKSIVLDFSEFNSEFSYVSLSIKKYLDTKPQR